MKILFITDGLAPFVIGGIQQHSTMMVKHLAPLVKEICVMHCGYPNETPASESDVLEIFGSPSNVKVIGVVFKDAPSFPGHYLRASKEYSLNLYKAISDKLSYYDFIYAQGFTGYAFLGKHNKLVSNLHGLEMFQKSFSLPEKLEKLTFRKLASRIIQKSSYVISLGGRLTDILLGLGVERIILSPNGIDDKWILDSSSKTGGTVSFVFIGRNEKRKAFPFLIKAIKQSKEIVTLNVIGPWPEIKTPPHNLTYYGEIKSKDKIFEIIDASDVLVVPSLSEGMPTVILEAMARGKAIIATDVGAVSDLVSDKTGVLIKPGSLEELTRAIQKMNTTDFRTTSKASTDKVAKFVWQKVANNLLKELK
jgi:glycosyltransferase involved in cell wall biosynthesis